MTERRRRVPPIFVEDIMIGKDKRGLLYHGASVAPYNDREYIWKCLDEAKLEFPRQFLEEGTVEYRPELKEWLTKWFGEK